MKFILLTLDGMVRMSPRSARNTERKEGQMAKTSPWHSIKATVHHDNTECNTGNNIEKENRREGTGGKPLCTECANLKK